MRTPAGQPIPDDESLRVAFATVPDYLAAARRARSLARDIAKLSEGMPKSAIGYSSHAAALGGVEERLRNFECPHAICPAWPNCKLGTCTTCNGRGWVGKRQWKMVKDMAR